MAFKTKYTTSLWGRRFGLQKMTTPETGSNHKAIDFLVGAEDIRKDTTTAASTATNLKPFGVSVMDGSSAASSSVFTIDPPIPGVEKVLVFNSTVAAIYVKAANSETFQSSLATTFTVLRSTGLASVGVRLQGLTTAVWQVLGQISSGSIYGATST